MMADINLVSFSSLNIFGNNNIPSDVKEFYSFDLYTILNVCWEFAITHIIARMFNFFPLRGYPHIGYRVLCQKFKMAWNIQTTLFLFLFRCPPWKFCDSMTAIDL